MNTDAPSLRRRLMLARAVKGLGLIAIIAFGLVLFASLPSRGPEEPPQNAMQLSVGDLRPGSVRWVDWQGRRLLVLRRTPAMLAALERLGPALRDPDSRASRQPEAARNRQRSLRPGLFVALGYGAGAGCPLEFVPPEAKVPVQRWAGGFRDPCDLALYDPAGRVYRKQGAPRNLVVPRHRYIDEHRIELENTD